MKPLIFIKHLLAVVILCTALLPNAMAEPAAAAAPAATAAAPAQAANLNDALNRLAAADFDGKLAAMQQVVRFQHPRQAQILQALTEGRLYAVGGSFYEKTLNGGEERFAPIERPDAAGARPAGAKRVVIDNDVRLWIRTYNAENALRSPDADIREAAMKTLLQTSGTPALDKVKSALPNETSATVRSMMESYIARADLESGDFIRHVHAVELLRQHASPDNLAVLEQYAAHAPTPALKEQAVQAAASVETKLSLLQGAETFSFGLSLGSVLVLTAIGLAITFGVMGVINMAHGELMMIGAYCAYVVQLLMPNHIGASVLVAIPVAFAVSGLVGILIERLVVRHLYGRPLETLLATFGISLILQQAVRSIFSPLNRMVQTPDWMSGSLEIVNGLSITWNRIYIFFFCLACFFALWAVMKRTRLGLEVRAVSMNRNMARAVGISDRKVDMLTFGLGSGIAGVAGVALSQLANVGPNLGQQYIVDSFMVVVVGGVSNLWGTLVSGLMLGVLNKMMEPWLGAVLAKAVMLVVIILFIQKFPRGLFPQKGRGVE